MDVAEIPTFNVNPPGDLIGRASFAVFDHSRTNRFWLVRIVDREKPLLVVCMFNPSDADEEKNDPTVSILLHFAQSWGYGGIIVVNLHSYVTSQPTAVARAWKIGIDTCPYPNVAAWNAAIAYATERSEPILVAWGNLGDPATIKRFARILVNTPTICLGTTGHSYPKHPMARGQHRVPSDFDPQPFDWSVYDDA